MRKFNLLSLLSLVLIAMAIFSCEDDEALQEAITLSEEQISLNAGASSVTVDVTSNTGWSAAVFDAGANHDWITVSPASGMYDGAITISVAENVSQEARSAVVRVFSNARVASVGISQEGADAPKPQESPIAQLRAMYQGEDIVIEDNLVIEATVISDYRAKEDGGLGNATSKKAMVISDGISGIQIRCAEDNSKFAKDDKVSVSLKGSTLTSYSGVLQINNLPLSSITKIGTKPLTPIEITAEQLVSGEYESMYVAVSDVQVAESDMGKNFGSANSHTSINFVSRSGETFVIFTSSYASFIDTRVPTGSGVLKGIATRFNETIQISLTSMEDVAALTGERFDLESGAEVKSIAYVRSLYKGSTVAIAEDIAIEGVVISDFRRNSDGGLNNYTSAKAIVISDGSAGIQLFCTSDNKEFARGNKVRVLLKDQKLSVYNSGSALQISDLPSDNISMISESEPIEAKEITVEQLLSGDYESMYVKVKDVQVALEDLSKTFVVDNNHTSIKIVDKTGRNFDLFSSKYSVFKDEKVPQGSGDLCGIAGINNGKYQLIISSKSDYASLDGPRFDSAPAFSLEGSGVSVSGDAGSVRITLVANVAWSALSSSSDFTLSQTSGSEGAIITVSFTDNPSSTENRVATITFTTEDSGIENKTLTYTITQTPFELLVEDAPQKGWLELPSVEVKEEDGYAYIAHRASLDGSDVRNYSMLYDTENRLALWVAYPLYGAMMGESGRTDAWEYDPKVPKRYQAELYRSYGASGYDRGHQLPSADRTASREINNTTFYFTNMTPQNSSFNQGIWANLEGKVRNWANGCDTLYVVTGAMLSETPAYVQGNREEKVAVPEAYFKVLLRYSSVKAAQNGGYDAIGFWFENRSYSQSSVTAEFAKSVDQIESLTGYDFFTNLAEGEQTTAEGSFNAASWGL